MRIKRIAVLLVSMLLMSVNAASADAGQTNNKAKRNPFINDFLPVCGQFAISGIQSKIWTSDAAKTVLAVSPIEIRIKDESATCNLTRVYRSDVSDIEEARRERFQPWWLKDINLIVSAFEVWIGENRASADLRPGAKCERKQGRIGPVTEVLYSRSVSIGDTRRNILVQITRSAHSYLDADRGHSIILVAIATNGPVDCV